MLILNVAQLFSKVAQKYPQGILLTNDVFHSCPKSQHTIWLLFCDQICQQELSKIAQSSHTEFIPRRVCFVIIGKKSICLSQCDQ